MTAVPATLIGFIIGLSLEDNTRFWSFVGKAILDDRPEIDVFMVDEIHGFTQKSAISKSESADFKI